MITNEMLRYLLQHCVANNWCSQQDLDEVMESYKNRKLDIFHLEAVIDCELQIMSLSDALDIIRKEFPFDD